MDSKYVIQTIKTVKLYKMLSWNKWFGNLVFSSQILDNITKTCLSHEYVLTIFFELKQLKLDSEELFLNWMGRPTGENIHVKYNK